MNKQYPDSPLPYSVIDVGTNTIRLLIGYTIKGKLVRLLSDRSVTRLGKNLNNTGKLHKESIKKSITSLLRFKELSEKYGVKHIYAVGTSALRDAKNSKEFLNIVKEKTGINIRVISGEEEAELTLTGVLNNRKPVKPSLIIDIGGGSTEWAYCSVSIIKGRKPGIRRGRVETTAGSLKVGAVRLFEKYIKHDPPAQAEIQMIKKNILNEMLKTIPPAYPQTGTDGKVCASRPCQHAPKLRGGFGTTSGSGDFKIKLIATGGTPTTVAAIDMKLGVYNGDLVHMHKIKLNALELIFDELALLPHQKRSRITGLEPGRADIIIPGILILLTIMKLLEIKEVSISDYGLLEGLLMTVIRNHGRRA